MINTEDDDAELIVVEADEGDDLAKRSRKMLNQLADAVHLYRKDLNRVRGLVTFAPRKPRNGSPATREISQVCWADRPEVELYLNHRDAVLAIEHDMRLARGKLEVVTDPALMASILGELNRLESSRLRNVNEMQSILATLAKERTNSEGVLAAMAKDGAKLAQAATQHADKMSLARSEPCSMSDQALMAIAIMDKARPGIMADIEARARLGH